jgi:hypothetical protein
MGKLRLKELVVFEDFPCFLELLQLVAGDAEFFFLLRDVLPHAIDLVKKGFHRGFLFPRFPSGLTDLRGFWLSRLPWFLCCHGVLLFLVT